VATTIRPFSFVNSILYGRHIRGREGDGIGTEDEDVWLPFKVTFCIALFWLVLQVLGIPSSLLLLLEADLEEDICFIILFVVLS
jgi:hypothetical protein